MKCAVFSSSRRTRRRPLAIFYRILNIASVSAFILYKSYKDTPIIKRFDFVKQLAYDLIIPYLHRRLANPSVQRGMRENIRNVLGKNLPQEPQRQDVAGTPTQEARVRKHAQRPLREEKTRSNLECSKKVCVRCAGGEVTKN